MTIGDHCNFGPNVTIVTPMHPYAALHERRGMGVRRWGGAVLCYAKPVTIGHDCWFGANVVVCPGVTIGENCVIGAGSVVTRDIPCGLLCRRQSGPGHPPDYGGGYRPRPLPRHPGGSKKPRALDNSSRPSQSIEKSFDRLLNF